MALGEIIKGDVSPMCRQKSKIDNIITDRRQPTVFVSSRQEE